VSVPVRVLLVEASFAVGFAVEQRLTGLACVEHSDGEDLALGARDGRAFDVVLLCPYVPEDLCARILDRVGPDSPPPSLVVLSDLDDGARADLLNRAPGTPPAVDALIAALVR
jgi:hypothetical protein